jgi:hypothetical protein
MSILLIRKLRLALDNTSNYYNESELDMIKHFSEHCMISACQDQRSALMTL